MSRSSALQVLERTGDQPAQDVVVDDTPVPPAERARFARRVARANGLPVPLVDTDTPGRVASGRRFPHPPGLRLPHPPGRRAPLWFAALVAGALLAMLPSLLGSPVAVTDDASDYGLGAGSEGLDVGDVRRSITEAEAQLRLGELAASRAARAPKTVLPTQGRLTTCYCMRWGQMHYGLDLAAPLGTPIYSAADGVVLKAGRVSGFGNAVYIQDADGNVHIYGHMRYYDVKAGQIVHAGDQIAKVGNEGYSTGPHLHYEIHRGDMDGRPLDPEQWLAERGVNI